MTGTAFDRRRGKHASSDREGRKQPLGMHAVAARTLSLVRASQKDLLKLIVTVQTTILKNRHAANYTPNPSS